MTAPHDALLPNQPPLRIRQNPGKPHQDWVDRSDFVIAIVPPKPAAKLWQHIPEGAALKTLASKRRLKDKPALTRANNSVATGVTVARFKPDATTFDHLTHAGKLIDMALKDNPATITIQTLGFKPEQESAVLNAMVLAVEAHRFEMPVFRSKPADTKRLKTLRLVPEHGRIDTARAQAEAGAVNLARWLTSLPPNVLDAAGYKNALKLLAKDFGWKSEFFSEKKLAVMGAGAFLAVSQANATRDAGIMKLSYRPPGSNKQPAVALVGKGIIFDTGGTNLKPFKAMLDMHIDMAGSAVAVATLCALSVMKAPIAVDCWLAITENRIGNTAYKSRDVVTASNGTTIEVIHTDAEGRMALADTLALAGKEKPAAIIDFATLTGSCIAALTERYSGVLSNRDDLHQLLIQAGRESGERVWPFPMDDDFDEEIKSNVADVLQCAPAGGGDHIQAARFMQRFVPDDSAWVHIDLSAAQRKGGLAQVPTEITGFGARYALTLLLDHLDELTNAAGK